MTLAESITEIYENKMPKVAIMLPHDEAVQYFTRLLMNGNIITYIKDGELLGFIEFWRINYEQFGRMCCNMTLAHEENLLEGNICVITRMWITPDLRNTEVFRNILVQFLEKNYDSLHFTAFQHHKKHKALQVFYRRDWIKHL